MTNNKLDPRTNRFERWYQASANVLRQRFHQMVVIKLIGLLILSAFILEATALGAVFVWYKSRGINSVQFLEKFHLTRIFVSPFVFNNPVNELTDAEYIGSSSRSCVAAQRFMADPLLGWRMRKNIGFLKQPFQVNDVVGWRFTNEQGFASSGEYKFKYTKEKPPEVYRIIVTGGSTVEGDGGEDPMASLPSQIVAELRARQSAVLPDGYKRIEVINAGVGGYRLIQEYLYTVSELAAYSPNLVISYSGLNDFAYAKMYFDQKGIVQNPQRLVRHDELTVQIENSFTILGATATLWTNLTRNFDCFVDDFALSFVLGKVFEKIEALFATSSPQRSDKSPPAVESVPTYIRAGLQSYKEGLTMMRDAADLKGFQLAVFLQPVMGFRDKPMHHPAEKEYINKLGEREIGARQMYFDAARGVLESISLLERQSPLCAKDLTGIFEDVQERVWEDSRHVLARGNSVVAKNIVDSLLACKLLGKGK